MNYFAATEPNINLHHYEPYLNDEGFTKNLNRKMNNQLLVKMALDNWNAKVKDLDKLLSLLTDEQLMSDVAPGRNSGYYLLGHLTAVNDHMLPLLGFGEQQFPQLNELFIRTPDKSKSQNISASDLRNYWNASNANLNEHFSKMQPEDWFMKHTSVTEEDFAKEPHRNKLNIIISRATHLAYHTGQMALLKK